MTNTYTMGPGVLTLNAGSALAVAAQITNCRVEWAENVTSTDARPTLDGGELAASEDATYRATLAGTAIQDLDAGGFVAYTWANKGKPCAFLFVPANSELRGVQGTCYPQPLTLGGDVKANGPTSDFSWRTQAGADAEPQLIDVDVDQLESLVGPNV